MSEKQTAPAIEMSHADLRKFGLILAVGIVIMFGLFLPWLADRPINLIGWPWRIAAGILAVGLVAPILLKPVYKAWMFIGHILGFVNTRIILGLIYLLVFTPFAVALKLMRKDPMSRKLDREQASYRVDSDQPKVENLNRPY